MGKKIKQTEIKEVIRSVVKENIKEVTTNDWHFKAIMAIWDKGGSFTRKKIGTILLKDPNASKRDVEDALRNSGYDEVTDVTDRLRIESIITEKQFKGLDGIPANTPLDKISKDQKLKIIKAPGNIIDFIVPKGVSRNFWQVIGTGKIKQNSADEFYLEGKVINSPMFKSLDDLIKGVLWKSMEERRRFNEGVIKEEDSIPGGLAKGMTLNDIAEKHGVSVDVLVAEFKKGIQTEMEHTTDREMAKEITLDHLFEDPQYYTKLATVEEYVDDKGVEHVAAALPQTEEEPIKEEDNEESSPEQTLAGLKEMAMGNLERIGDYAKMITERMQEGQELESWMYSQLTIALENLNSVHDAMDGSDGVKESVNEGLKHLIHVGTPKEIVSKSVASQIMALAKKGVRSNEIGLNMHFVGNEKAAVDAFQKVKNKIYFALDTQNESVNEATEPDVITQIKTIAKNHQHDVIVDPKSGKKMKVDAFSASAIATVYDALSDSNKEKFVSSGLLGMQSTAMKLLKR